MFVKDNPYHGEHRNERRARTGRNRTFVLLRVLRGSCAVSSVVALLTVTSVVELLTNAF
jgi:hypothetical protein